MTLLLETPRAPPIGLPRLRLKVRVLTANETRTSSSLRLSAGASRARTPYGTVPVVEDSLVAQRTGVWPATWVGWY